MFGPQPSTRPMSAVQRRRRDVLLALAVAVGLTFVAAVALRSTPVIVLNVLADAALVFYVYMLVQVKHRTREQRAKVRYLGPSYRPSAVYLTGAPDHYGTSQSSGPRLVPLRQTASR